MGLLEKYLNHSAELNKEFAEVRTDKKILFSQDGTNLSSVYWIKTVIGFPYEDGRPLYQYRIVNGERVDKPIYPKAIIRIRLNSQAMKFIARSGPKIRWKDFEKLEGWRYTRGR